MTRLARRLALQSARAWVSPLEGEAPSEPCHPLASHVDLVHYEFVKESMQAYSQRAGGSSLRLPERSPDGLMR